MTRAISLTCFALCILGASSAFAAKPSIVVLGLEVVDPGGAPTAADTQVAKELTEGLRARAKVGAGQYQLAPGSEKELIDQKLLHNCDNEAPSCMSLIGTNLGADYLMFGKLEKKDKGFLVTLKLLEVGNKKADVKSTRETLSASEVSGSALTAVAKKMYSKLTGDNVAAGATLVVKLTNAERGTILLNGEQRGTINEGTGTVAGLDGRTYHLAIESGGFRRYEKDVTLGTNKTETISAELEPSSQPLPAPGGGSQLPEGRGGGGGGSKSGGGNTAWWGLAIGGLAVGVGGGTLWVFEYLKKTDIEKGFCEHGNDCVTSDHMWSDAKIAQLNTVDGPRHERNMYIGVGITAVGAALATVAFIKIYTTKKSPRTEQQGMRGRRVRKDRTFVVTPVLSRQGGAATLRFDW